MAAVTAPVFAVIRFLICFRVKTTNPKKYCVRPNTGVVLPRSTCDVTVTMQAQKEAPPDMQCSDKFLIQSVIIATGITPKEITSEMFSKEAGHNVEVCKLKVVYQSPPQPPCKLKVVYQSPPQPPSPVAEGSEEGDDTAMEKRIFNGSEGKSCCMTSGPLLVRVMKRTFYQSPLQIDPLELKFAFELKKEISCSFQLSNKTKNHVAFKVKTTNPIKYCVRPNIGVVLPRSTCEVTVTMRAQKEAPPDMQCSDKFLLQSVIIATGITPKEITSEMFSKEAGHNVEECKLKVVYQSPPQPPSPVAVGFEEGDDTAIEKGSFNGYELLRVLKNMMILPWRNEASMDPRDPKGLLTPLLNLQSQDQSFETKGCRGTTV